MTRKARRLMVMATTVAGLAACCPVAGELIVREPASGLAETGPPPGVQAATPGEPVLCAEGWEPAIREQLSALIRSAGRPDLPLERRPVAILDFDNTCLRNDLGNAVFLAAVEELAFDFEGEFWETIPEDLGRDELREAVTRVLGRAERRDLEKDPDYLFWRKQVYRAYETIWARESCEDASAWLASTFVGLHPAEIRTLTRRTLARHLTSPLGHLELREDERDDTPVTVHQGLRFYDPIRDLVGALQRHGFDVWVVSASNQWTVEVGAAHVGVPVDHIVGVRIDQDERGRLTRRAQAPVTCGPGKMAAIRAFTGREPTLVVGDGLTDREMLGAATGLAVLIDKGDEDLRALALEKGWPIQPEFPVE